MVIKGLSHMALNVSDMEKSVNFYCNVLGFQKVFDMPHPEKGTPWIEYLYGGKDQFLELFHGGVNYIEYDKTNIGFSHICYEVEDINETAKKIVEAGWTLDRPVEYGCDNNWQCWIHDPDQNRIEIMQITQDSPQAKFLEALESKKNK